MDEWRHGYEGDKMKKKKNGWILHPAYNWIEIHIIWWLIFSTRSFAVLFYTSSTFTSTPPQPLIAHLSRIISLATIPHPLLRHVQQQPWDHTKFLIKITGNWIWPDQVVGWYQKGKESATEARIEASYKYNMREGRKRPFLKICKSNRGRHTFSTHPINVIWEESNLSGSPPLLLYFTQFNFLRWLNAFLYKVLQTSGLGRT